MSGKNTSLLALAVTLAFAVSPASAEDAAATPEKPTRVIEGSVKGTVLLFDDGCARIGMARGLIQESCEKIMKEATRKDTIVVRGPNAIGNGIIIPAIGGAGGVMQFGEMPIRRDKLARWVAENEQNIAALQSYVDAIIMPPEQVESLSTVYASMKTTMQETQDNLTKLKELAAQKRLANGKIGRVALHIYDEMAELEKQRGQLLQLATAANAGETTAPPTPTTTDPAK